MSRSTVFCRRLNILPECRRTRLIVFWSLVFSAVCPWAPAQEKVTYQDNILPLVQANCAKCHNADKKKADLDLTSFQSLMKGSGSGAIVTSGNVDGSKVWRSLTHAEEPFMPPNSPKLPDKDLDLFKQWIAGGLLEKAGSTAIAAAKSGPDLELKPDALGKPEGPPPIPQELPVDPVVHTARGTAITGLACSPWAPVLAVAGQKQVLIYNTDTFQLLGILPFTEGEPVCIKFSQNGKLLLAGGGQAAKSGRVMLWDVVTGEPLTTLGREEYDSVLATDLRPDQSQVALGGPSRLIKIYSVKTGEVQQKVKKHTDWVTALAYSPNGQMLASADRNGGVSVWDPDSAQELFTLAGHKSAVTALSWRPDSKILASCSEDGTVKLWELQEGKQVKSWTANAGGTLSASYAANGQFVTCGRDNAVTLWDSNGGKPRHLEFFGNLPVRAVFSADARRVIATDFDGRVAVWSVADAKRIGEINVNPLPLSSQIADAQKAVSALQASVDSAAPKIATVESNLNQAAAELDQATKGAEAARSEEAKKKAEVAQLSALVSATNAPPELPGKLAAASTAWNDASAKLRTAVAVLDAKAKEHESFKAALAKAKAESPAAALAEAKATLARLEAAKGLTLAWQLRPAISTRKREHEKLASAVETARQTLKQSEQELAAAKAAAAKAEAQLKSAKTQLTRDEPLEKQLATELATEQAKLDAYLTQYRMAATNAAATPVTQAKK